MNIDWSNQPEEFPLWLEGIGEHACWSGWYQKSGEVFRSEDGGQFRSVREGQFFIVHRKPEEVCAHSEANRLGCPECGADFSRPGYVRAPWNGEGLPPVSLECEVMGGGLPSTAFDWERCTILLINEGADGKPQVCTRDFRGDLAIYYPEVDSVYFRPIRTAEQIAAEERRKENVGLADQISGFHGGETTEADLQLAEYLYDHDYRKQPPK